MSNVRRFWGGIEKKEPNHNHDGPSDNALLVMTRKFVIHPLKPEKSFIVTKSELTDIKERCIRLRQEQKSGNNLAGIGEFFFTVGQGFFWFECAHPGLIFITAGTCTCFALSAAFNYFSLVKKQDADQANNDVMKAIDNLLNDNK